MSRATECLMDAGCLNNFSSEQSAQSSKRKRGRGFIDAINLWQERSRQRQELRELAKDADLLKDVGLSRYDVHREGRKPFWRG